MTCVHRSRTSRRTARVSSADKSGSSSSASSSFSSSSFDRWSFRSRIGAKTPSFVTLTREASFAPTSYVPPPSATNPFTHHRLFLANSYDARTLASSPSHTARVKYTRTCFGSRTSLPRARAPSLSPAPASRRALSNLSRHRRRNRPLRIRLGSITHTSAASVRCNTSYASVPFPPATSTTRASRKSKASRNQSVNARTFSCDARPRLLARALDPGASDVARASCENRHASPYRQNPPRAKCLHGGAREASASSIEVRRGVGTGHRGTRDES